MKKITLFLLLSIFIHISIYAQPTNYYLTGLSLNTGVTMTNNSPVNGIVSYTTQATSTSTGYLISWDN